MLFMQLGKTGTMSETLGMLASASNTANFLAQKPNFERYTIKVFHFKSILDVYQAL